MERSIEVNTSSGLVGISPIVTKRYFSQLSGLTEDTVRGMIERGQLPSVKLGRHRMINIALLTKESLENDFQN